MRNVVVDEDVNLLFPLPVREPWSPSIAALIAQCTWTFAARQLLSLPRLTGSRILCHIRSFQMSSRARKYLSRIGYFRYEVEFVDPGPCFLKQSSATHISSWV